MSQHDERIANEWGLSLAVQSDGITRITRGRAAVAEYHDGSGLLVMPNGERRYAETLFNAVMVVADIQDVPVFA